MFYFGITGRFFDRLTVTTQAPVSQPYTRKTFFGRLAAIFAVSALTPKLFAKSAPQAVAHPTGETSFRLQSDTRAIARDVDSL